MDLIAVYFTACMMLLIFPLMAFLLFMLIYKKRRNENTAQLTRLHSRNAFVSELSSFHDDITLLIKDMDSLAACISRQAPSKDVNALETRCHDQCTALLSDTASGNDVIDALLHQKSKLCKERGVLFQNQVSALPQNGISESELVALLGNLLDNAIEAACKASGNAFVSIGTYSAKGAWIATVTNSKAAGHTPLSDHMRTTKEDFDNHGMGIKIIKKITARYDGVLKMEDASDTFIVTVSMLNKG